MHGGALVIPHLPPLQYYNTTTTTTTTTSLLQYQHITHDDNTTVLMELIPNPTAVNSITASSLPTLPAATVIAIAVVQDCNLLCCLLVKDRKKIMSYY